MSLSIHDNYLRGYEVDADARTIVLHTIFEDREPYEHTDIVFRGVCAYHFQNDNFGTILFDVSEDEITRLYADHRNLWEQGQRYGWPDTWNTSESAALTYLASRPLRGWRITSSFGMDGWVIAEAMELIARAGSDV